MTEYKKVITNIGEQIISRKGLDNEELNISYIAIGDANGSMYEPSKTQTELVNQLDLLPITEYIDNAPQHRFIADIPQDIDYYTIREIGLIDVDGNLIQVAQIEMPTKYNDGSLLQELQIGMLLEITQADNIVIVVDSTEIAQIKNDISALNSGKEDKTNKGVANGYAELDNTGKVPTSQLPELGSTVEITYADNTTADLKTVKYQTESTFASRTVFPKDQIEVVEYNGETPLYFTNAKTISASTNYTYTLNGTFCTNSSSVATVTITDSNSNSVTVYGNVVRIPANCTFSSSVAGKFYFDNNYYGYLAS